MIDSHEENAPLENKEELRENARNFRLNMWIFGGGFAAIIIYVFVGKWLGWL